MRKIVKRAVWSRLFKKCICWLCRRGWLDSRPCAGYGANPVRASLLDVCRLGEACRGYVYAVIIFASSDFLLSFFFIMQVYRNNDECCAGCNALSFSGCICYFLPRAIRALPEAQQAYYRSKYYSSVQQHHQGLVRAQFCRNFKRTRTILLQRGIPSVPRECDYHCS